MAKNPETVVTNRFRKTAELRGADFVKLSDSFTRGVPDAYMVTDRVIMVEFKVDRTKGTMDTRSYKSLGLSGAQDHRIRNISRRSALGACVVIDSAKGGQLQLFVPVGPSQEGPGHEDYVRLAEDEEVFRWLSIPRT